MTIQQICDRLAEEAGWKQVRDETTNPAHVFFTWVKDNVVLNAPFRDHSIDDAIRGVGNDYYMSLWGAGGKWRAMLALHGMSVGVSGGEHSLPSHAVYFAIAKARGWM